MADFTRNEGSKTALEIGKKFIDDLNTMISYGPVIYHEYINSREWKNKAELIKHQRGFRCQMCNISGYVSVLHVHHNTYERIRNEKDGDMIVLCSDCHKLFHDNKKPQANKIRLSDEEIKKILHCAIYSCGKLSISMFPCIL